MADDIGRGIETLRYKHVLVFSVMKLQIVLIAVCVCAASAGIPKRLFKKYAMQKVVSLSSSWMIMSLTIRFMISLAYGL